MIPDLAAVLAEKDRRAAETALLLAGMAGLPDRPGTCHPGYTQAEPLVVRLSARLPATLRYTDRAAIALALGAARFASRCMAAGFDLTREGTGTGVLGPWTVWTTRSDPVRLKRFCMASEADGALGALLDIDVETVAGHLGRAALETVPRTCPVCGGNALVCSGRSLHGQAQVHSAFTRLLSIALHQSGSAVGVYREAYRGTPMTPVTGGACPQPHPGGDTP